MQPKCFKEDLCLHRRRINSEVFICIEQTLNAKKTIPTNGLNVFNNSVPALNLATSALLILTMRLKMADHDHRGIYLNYLAIEIKNE
jgi:hypothetical protein